MCDCNNINMLSLPSYLKIYTDMAKYEIKKAFKGLGAKVSSIGLVMWDDASQELLAHLYEDKKFTSIITKISSNEESNIKKSIKKSKSSTKDN